MNPVVPVILAIGAATFLVYAGWALYESAKRVRCTHKWKTVRETAVYSDQSEIEGAPVAHLITLQCEGCGEITSRKVRA